jgi:hypothetical protein
MSVFFLKGCFKTWYLWHKSLNFRNGSLSSQHGLTDRYIMKQNDCYIRIQQTNLSVTFENETLITIMSVAKHRKRIRIKVTDFLLLPISPEQHKQLWKLTDQQFNYPDEMSICANAINSITPLIRTLVIRFANYPDRLRRSGISTENSTKLTCLEITGYRIKYSTVFWLLELQIRRGRRRYIL